LTSVYLSLSHVDDFLCVGTKTNYQSTKTALEKQFKLKSTKDIVHLGIKILCKLDGTLQMSQEHYFNVGQIRERDMSLSHKGWLKHC
jgi:hypothetical protein